MRKKSLGILLCLAALLVTAWSYVPTLVPTEPCREVESILRANSERCSLSERNARMAILPESLSRIVPPSARTTFGRLRTHTSLLDSAGIANQRGDWNTSEKLFGIVETQVCHFTSRAVDYYIYALRHIII